MGGIDRPGASRGNTSADLVLRSARGGSRISPLSTKLTTSKSGRSDRRLSGRYILSSSGLNERRRTGWLSIGTSAGLGLDIEGRGAGRRRTEKLARSEARDAKFLPCDIILEGIDGGGVGGISSQIVIFIGGTRCGCWYMTSMSRSMPVTGLVCTTVRGPDAYLHMLPHGCVHVSTCVVRGSRGMKGCGNWAPGNPCAPGHVPPYWRSLVTTSPPGLMHDAKER